VKLFRRLAFDETLFRSEEAISLHRRRGRETLVWNHAPIGQQWGSIMSAIITLIYRAYCLARLAEMRKYHLAHW